MVVAVVLVLLVAAGESAHSSPVSLEPPPADVTDAIVGRHLVEQARSYLDHGNDRAAWQTLRQAAELRDTPLRRLMMAQLAEQADRPELALTHLRRARELTSALTVRTEYFRIRAIVQRRASKRHVESLQEEEREAKERRRRLLEERRAEARRIAAELERQEAADDPSDDHGSEPSIPPRDDDVDWVDDALVQGLSSDSSLVRRNTASALAEQGRVDALWRIADRLVDDDDRFVRMAAASALGTLGVETGVTPLVEALFAEESELVIGRIINALGDIGTPSARRALYRWRDQGEVPELVSDRLQRVIRELDDGLGPDDD